MREDNEEKIEILVLTKIISTIVRGIGEVDIPKLEEKAKLFLVFLGDELSRRLSKSKPR